MQARYYIKHIENIGLVGNVSPYEVKYALDLGCGKGGDAEYLESLGYTITAVDKKKYYGKALVADLFSYKIESGKYDLIICNNVLPFIGNKDAVKSIVWSIVKGLKTGGAAFLTFYGPNSGFKNRSDMSFFEYDEILSFVKNLRIEIMDQTTTEGYTRNGQGKIIYQHSHRFILANDPKLNL